MTAALTPREAREKLSQTLQRSIPRETFYRWLREGILPAQKIVGRWAITTQDLDRFVKECKW